MNPFRKRTAIRIAMISLLMAAGFGSLSWYIARERAEQSVVALAREESGRLLHFYKSIDLNGAEASRHAQIAARAIVGGMFDIAEIYNNAGTKLAVSMTPTGEQVEALLPKHLQPSYQQVHYQSETLPDGRWVLQIFVPLRQSETDLNLPITGYFEGVRVVPSWQREQIFSSSWTVAIMACLASLLCGGLIYPVVIHLSTDNERKTREVLDAHHSMMEAFGRAIAKRDTDTGAHNYRVAWIATRIGERLGLRNSTMQALIAGSFLHDVGKIAIPDAILLKPGQLDEKELQVMQSHVVQGEEIVSGIGWLDEAGAVVAAHHEKWDGSGYPRQLAGEGIPLVARIFAVADVFDALCSRRPYKEPLDLAQAMAILEKDSGRHFDDRIMRAFHPMAKGIYDRLKGCGDEEVREILLERIQHHFGL